MQGDKDSSSGGKSCDFSLVAASVSPGFLLFLRTGDRAARHSKSDR